MSLDQLVDQELDGETGAQQDPGGEGDHAEHRGGETSPGEVSGLEEDDEEGRDQDVRAPPEFELAEVVIPGEDVADVPVLGGVEGGGGETPGLQGEVEDPGDPDQPLQQGEPHAGRDLQLGEQPVTCLVTFLQ